MDFFAAFRSRRIRCAIASPALKDAIVLCHLGVPRIEREEWSLAIDGLVASPLILTFADLRAFEGELTCIHQCAGSPLQPFEPTRRICNVNWAGAPLSRHSRRLRSPMRPPAMSGRTGADLANSAALTSTPMSRICRSSACQSDVLIAYEMNGEALNPEHGFPARLVVPGFYGTNSVKWITRISSPRSGASALHDALV